MGLLAFFAIGAQLVSCFLCSCCLGIAMKRTFMDQLVGLKRKMRDRHDCLYRNSQEILKKKIPCRTQKSLAMLKDTLSIFKIVSYFYILTMSYLKNALPYIIAILLLISFLRRNENICPYKHFYTKKNNLKLDTVQISINRRMDTTKFSSTF